MAIARAARQPFRQCPDARLPTTAFYRATGGSHPLRSNPDDKGSTTTAAISGQDVDRPRQGLLWDQTSPFPMQLLLDDKRMVQAINGQPPQTVTAENNPQMFQFNHLLRALFQADRKVLEQNFRVEFADLGEGRWTLRLTPITTPLDKIFATIDLAGKTYLESIQLNDKQGDRTDIALSQHQLTPAQLTDDERQRFAAQ